ncbi:Hit-type zinc finger family protein [Thalictrum thalictroides]|uniref:Hit-type zinc finger family protein n=1 Tax=Thalictrum thalictroides TaxID=46969 RepID=A0A7J6WFA1_THATH|nr:Hit-type zinc finger family protein [Thalictrum thalictroides]
MIKSPEFLLEYRLSQVPLKNSISWTIEWRFHFTDVVLIDNWVDENQSLCSVIEKHLKPGPWSNQLKPFFKQQLDSLKFFIRKNAKGTKSPFRELDMKTPLIQQLANTIVLEYPVIHVFPPSASHDFEIVEDMNQSSQKSEPKEPVSDDMPSPKGVLFREEEVEDDISDPHIIDLLKCMNPELADKSRFANALKPSEKELQDLNIEDYGGFDWNELGVAEDFNLNFEQDLRDAFSGCIDEFNPDEFLDFGGFIDGELTMAEELEEGEILT